MSANGAKIDGTGYQETKHLAEEYLKYTNLDWTIFRPSLIFGNPRSDDRPEFCTQLKKKYVEPSHTRSKFLQRFKSVKCW